MRKDDFDRFWSACVPREARASNENIFDDVIKAIDNSEKYKHLTESKLLEQYRERGQKIHELSQLKERLKKLKIDTLAVLSDDSPNKEELQRVLNMINFALGEDGVKLTRIQCYHNHTKKVKDGIFCEDCQTQIQTYVLGEKRFGEEK